MLFRSSKNTGVGCHFLLQCMKVKSESEVAQSCPTPSNPMDCSLPGFSIHGIFQARVLEWGAIAFSEVKARNLFLKEMLYIAMFITNPTQSKANSYLLLSCFPTGQVLQPSEGRQSLSHQISSDVTLTGSPNTVCKDPSVPSQSSLRGWRGPRWDPK